MKTFIVIFIFIFTFVVFYLLLSVCGCFFTTYKNTISQPEWFAAYSIFIGWWLASLVCHDYIRSKE